MPYKKVPADHSEFGGGPGLIDPVRRADRVIGQETYAIPMVGEEAMEIYATNPADPAADPATADLKAERLY